VKRVHDEQERLEEATTALLISCCAPGAPGEEARLELGRLTLRRSGLRHNDPDPERSIDMMQEDLRLPAPGATGAIGAGGFVGASVKGVVVDERRPLDATKGRSTKPTA